MKKVINSDTWRQWSKQHRTLLVTVMLTVIVLAGVYLAWVRPWQQQLPAQLLPQIETQRRQLVEIRNQLTGLPSPGQIEFGQRDSSAAGQTETLKEATESYRDHSLALPSVSRIILAYQVPFTPRSLDLRPVTHTSVIEQADTASNEAIQLLGHHAATTAALRPLYEYNPAVDFRRFDLKTGDTQQRIARARDALVNIQQQLASQDSYPDPALTQVTEAVAQLESDLGTLERGGELADWQTAVDQIQQDIRHNRAVFWDEASTATAAKLNRSITTLADLEYNLWQINLRLQD